MKIRPRRHAAWQLATLGIFLFGASSASGQVDTSWPLYEAVAENGAELQALEASGARGLAHEMRLGTNYVVAPGHAVATLEAAGLDMTLKYPSYANYREAQDYLRQQYASVPADQITPLTSPWFGGSPGLVTKAITLPPPTTTVDPWYSTWRTLDEVNAKLDAISNYAIGSTESEPAGDALRSMGSHCPSAPHRPRGAPILYLTAENDTLHTPVTYACNLETFQDLGVTFESCLLAETNHFNITIESAATAFDRVTTGSLTCPPEATPPSCPE